MVNRYTLSELCAEIGEALDSSLAPAYWVQAEISSLIERGGHMYLDLVDAPSAGGQGAKMRATLWAGTKEMLCAYFQSETGMSLQKGMAVLVECEVHFHPVYGLSLSIVGIDPTAYPLSYAVGKGYSGFDVELAKLVGDLLYLSRMDHSGGMYERKRFSLSGAVLGAVLPFESVAFEAHKNLDTDIEENIFYNGDESKLKQLVVILLDNAIKNTFDGGTITVTLSGGENKPKISVRNEGEGIDEEDIPHIFERFYRCDDSRARGTGGFGLGLAIAHDIVEQHGGKLTVVSKKGQWTEFTAAL